MDITAASEAAGPGSIPGGDTECEDAVARGTGDVRQGRTCVWVRLPPAP